MRLDPSDVDALWDRSFLHKQLGRNPDAIAGFTQILGLMPHHYKVINELAQLYRVQGKTMEAVQMYEDAFVYHAENADESDDEEMDDDDEFTDKLGYSEINMLSELYLILNDYRKALETIKNGIRRIQHREEETWWSERLDDDDEYLEKEESRTEFPIELRVRMGVCRVYLNNVRLGTVSSCNHLFICVTKLFHHSNIFNICYNTLLLLILIYIKILHMPTMINVIMILHWLFSKELLMPPP